MNRDELLARIERWRIANCQNKLNPACPDIKYACGSCHIHSALRAVVEREEANFPHGEMDVTQKYYKSGYNQALADVRAAIEKELG